MTYADYTASGRSLTFIEDFIRGEVMALYANTHSETSGTGRQTSQFRDDARAIIHRAVGGGPDDLVIFCGSGATGAINKLLEALNLRLPADLAARYRLSACIPEHERPVVFIGPFEHHSNELPWRESIADVVVIQEDADGHVDLDHLERELVRYAARARKIGSFSAASNVTGITTDTHEITRLLHRHGALSLWDYAAAGPYLAIDMNPGDPLACKDAVFLSPHKFIGGPQTPGVLVVKRALLTNTVPVCPGGGTVAYVNEAEHRYTIDSVMREEGGTPAIIESIRAGLVFQLKEAVGVDAIREREVDFIQRALASWSTNPQIEILGNRGAGRLAIVSFIIRHRDSHLHHNYVVALLNDLFGIQVRGGCSCAGPYGHRLLGIDLGTSKQFEREIVRGSEGIKPGWVRINFNYFLSETLFQFIVDAIHLVASDGWRLLPHYTFDPGTGAWHHRRADGHGVLRLSDVSYRTGQFECRRGHTTEPEAALPGYLEQARQIMAGVSSEPGSLAIEDPPCSPDFEELRWFTLPGEVASELRSRSISLDLAQGASTQVDTPASIGGWSQDWPIT
ncbi:MAG TPA: aminotransferase class V-fold PLP-dependent enzyme [Kofleriaceae bacterium]|nr:aminotransferase class V-fold PLP-dependent enzyme [Kofleriaceae bacterium]